MFQGCMTRPSHFKTEGLGFGCESLGEKPQSWETDLTLFNLES